MTNKPVISLHIPFPRKEMVYHFTVYLAGKKKFYPPCQDHITFSIKKSKTKLKFLKHSMVLKGHLYFKSLAYLVHC